MSEKICNTEISNPDKILFNKGKITKLDIAKYYEKVAPFMLPFINNRLLSVIRYHGPKTQKFFKKHPDINEKIEKIYIKSPKTEENLYFYAKNKMQIVSQVQMGTIEFHTWGSKINALNKPDVMVFDLDPDKKVSLETLRQGVRHLKQILDELGLKSFLKTSGGKGYHIYVPFSSSKSWSSFEKFAQNVAVLMEERWPKLYISTSSKAKRKNKIFIDYMRNTKGATCVSPYSVRIRDDVAVSMPISYDELDLFTPNYFTIDLALQRLKQNINPWKSFFRVKQTLL